MTYRRLQTLIWLIAITLFCFAVPLGRSQQLSKRLILKDGSYQLATQWEIKGDRVRYLSAERNEWEELPKDLIDWDATDKFAKDRASGVPDAAAIELDKELEAERQAEEAKTPQVAPGLHLPDSSSVVLFDTFQNQPELIELQQNAGELNRNRKENMLKAAIIPIASAKQTIELTAPHAAIQAHTTLPSIYVNIEEAGSSAVEAPSNDKQQPQGPQPSQGSQHAQGPQQPEQPQQPQQPWDRFHIVRVQEKNGKRIVGELKVNPLGKVNQEQNLIAANSQRLTGGWVKVTPVSSLEPGEYAVVELLGKEGMNTFVWDFGVNPSAAANAGALRPENTTTQPAQPPQPKDLKTVRN